MIGLAILGPYKRAMQNGRISIPSGFHGYYERAEKFYGYCNEMPIYICDMPPCSSTRNRCCYPVSKERPDRIYFPTELLNRFNIKARTSIDIYFCIVCWGDAPLWFEVYFEQPDNIDIRHTDIRMARKIVELKNSRRDGPRRLNTKRKRKA